MKRVTLGIHVCIHLKLQKMRNVEIRQQAALFVLKERVLYYRTTDTMAQICLKRVIANEKERTKIIRACHDGVDGCHYGRDKTRAKVRY